VTAEELIEQSEAPPGNIIIGAIRINGEIRGFHGRIHNNPTKPDVDNIFEGIKHMIIEQYERIGELLTDTK
jgi:hypothetical protein